MAGDAVCACVVCLDYECGLSVLFPSFNTTPFFKLLNFLIVFSLIFDWNGSFSRNCVISSTGNSVFGAGSSANDFE